MSIHVNRDTKEVFTGDYDGTIKKWSLEDLRQAYFSTLKMVVLSSFSNLFCSTSDSWETSNFLNFGKLSRGTSIIISYNFIAIIQLSLHNSPIYTANIFPVLSTVFPCRVSVSPQTPCFSNHSPCIQPNPVTQSLAGPIPVSFTANSMLPQQA